MLYSSQHTPHEGIFKPWMDSSCLEVLPHGNVASDSYWHLRRLRVESSLWKNILADKIVHSNIASVKDVNTVELSLVAEGVCLMQLFECCGWQAYINCKSGHVNTHNQKPVYILSSCCSIWILLCIFNLSIIIKLNPWLPHAEVQYFCIHVIFDFSII